MSAGPGLRCELSLPTVSFYRETRFAWLPECVAGCLDGRSDYYYVIGQDVQTVRERVPASFACTDERGRPSSGRRKRG